MDSQVFFNGLKSGVAKTLFFSSNGSDCVLQDIKKAVLRLEAGLRSDGIRDLKVLWAFGRFLWADFSDNHMPAQLMDYAPLKNSAGIDFPGENRDLCVTFLADDESFLEIAQIEMQSFLVDSFELKEVLDYEADFRKGKDFLLGADDEGLGGGTYLFAQSWSGSVDPSSFSSFADISSLGGGCEAGFSRLSFSSESWRFEDALEELTSDQVNESCSPLLAGYYFAPSHELLVECALRK